MNNATDYSEEERIILNLVAGVKHEQLQEYLSQLRRRGRDVQNITKLVDSSGYTLIHQATYKNSLRTV